MRKLFIPCSALVVLLFAASCVVSGPNLPRRSFTLPKGDPQAGRAVFAKLQCYSCHQVAGEDFPAPVAQPPVPIVLGSDEEGKTREELAESVVAPSHRFPAGMPNTKSGGISRMPDFTREMSVRELIDLVEYLQSLQ